MLTKLNDLKLLAKAKIAETFSDEAASLARKRLIVGLVGIGANTPLPASFLKDFAVIAGSKLKNGGMKFADFAKQMTNQFGEQIKPYLEKLYRERMIEMGLSRVVSVEKIMADVDKWSLVRISEKQKTLIRENSKVVIQRSKEETELIRSTGFSKKQEKELIKLWEQNTGQKWIKGATPHHVIPLKNGGANEWWNLIPVKHPHTGTIHGTNSALREVLPYNLPEGTVTEIK